MPPPVPPPGAPGGFAPSSPRPPARTSGPAVSMIVGGLVCALVVGVVAFMITWLLSYPGDAFSDSGAGTPESEEIMRSWSSVLAFTIAVPAALFGGAVGVLLGLFGHRARTRPEGVTPPR